MTSPEGMFVEEAPSLIGIGADALVQNATRLGLTWVLRYGTVTTADPLTVTVDSDEIPVAMVSLIGALAEDTRVSVLIVSSKVHFVVGFPPGESSRMNLIQLTSSAATANLTLTASPQAITGTLITVTTPACVYDADGAFDMRCTASGTTTIQGLLYVDGAAATAQALFAVTTSGQRVTASQQWTGSLTAGTHTFELYGQVTALAGTDRIDATHTTLKLRLWG